MGYIKRTTLRVIWLNFIHLFFVSLLPFATAWIAATELARAPVVVYTSLCVVTDGAYNLFEREVLRNSRDFSPAELRASRRRSRTALALFAAAHPCPQPRVSRQPGSPAAPTTCATPPRHYG